jgi:pSer/pThr/pTyr-binding forkhead associated (FHA) protein
MVESNITDATATVKSGGTNDIRSGSQAVELPPRLTIGRAAECGLQLPDQTVSRQHAVIEWNDRSGYVLRDVGSRSGTLLTPAYAKPMN